MNGFQKGLLVLLIPNLLVVPGCKSYLSNVLKKTLTSLQAEEASTRPSDPEYEKVIRVRAYQTLRECDGILKRKLKDKKITGTEYRHILESAIISLQDIDDPNFFQISADYYNDYPVYGLRIFKRANEKQKEFKDKKTSSKR